MYLEYSPIQPMSQKCSDITMLFDPHYDNHANRIDNIQDGVSWENACEHAGNVFQTEGYIESDWKCEKDAGSTG